MSRIDIVEVESKAQLKQFIDYPNKLYADDPNYVTPLQMERLDFFNRDKNPFYRNARTKMFLAFQDGKIKGRIATCVNFQHNEYHQEQVGFFGFFDCPDDYEMASQLLKVAMITLKKEGMEKMRGPANFSTNHEVGFLVDGFDSPPMIMMTYNRPYLPRLAEKFGLKKTMDLLAYRIEAKDPIPERISRVVEKMRQRARVTMRTINMDDFNNEVARIMTIYNEAWAYNWGFVPMTKPEFEHLAKDLKQVVDPELLLIAEIDNKPIGFLLALPDINQALIRLKGKLFPFGLIKFLWHTKVRNKIDRCRVVTMGVTPEYRKRGIDSMLYVGVHEKAREHGYKWAEMSWILETNEMMRNASEHLGSKLHKRYRMVEMPI